MPIHEKDLGKYKRPGIFINEIDNSLIELPLQNVLINLVPGFSKKGPVNRPVYISNKNDFIAIFGDIDRSLERKGSYFHRTCLKMLESGPIWALNLLATDDNRDKIDWKSISCAAAFKNGATKKMPYSRLFNKQSFWVRDDESFLDYVNTPTPDKERILHLTNLGENVITVFLYKSNITGFDVTVEDWYGGAVKVPSYLHPKDLISDYMISVLVLVGDWTDYENLSMDPVWGQYFTSEGLIKDKIQDFVNEPNVVVSAYYDVSLIPYFKDMDGRDMYIKSVINNNTDRTGLFCAYDEALLLDSDYPTGKIDIIGDGIVGVEDKSIDFLSYKENIVEQITYTEKSLDSHNNVFGNFSSVLSSDYFVKNSRTASKTNWYVNDVSIANTASTLLKITVAAYSNGKSYLCLDYPANINFDDPSSPVSIYHRKLQPGDAVYLNKNFAGLEAYKIYYIEDVTTNHDWFTLSEEKNGPPLVFCTATTCNVPQNLYLQRVTVGVNTSSESYFNVGGAKYKINQVNEVLLDPLVINTTPSNIERYDVLYLVEGSNEIHVLKGVQSNNGNATLPDFTINYNSAVILGYVHLYTQGNVTPGTGQTDYAIMCKYTPITVNNNGYVPLTDIIITGYTSNNINYTVLVFGNTSGVTSLKNYNQLRYRAVYNEMEYYLDNGKGVIINSTNGHKHYIVNATFTDYSTTSNASITINTGSRPYTEFYINQPHRWLIYYVDDEFLIGSVNTYRLWTSPAAIEDLSPSGHGVIGRYSNIYQDIYNGIINTWDYFFEFNNTGSTIKGYIKTWMEGANNMYIDFVANDKVSPQPIVSWSSQYNKRLQIWSNMSNYKQTVEIEELDHTKLPNLVYEIKVDKNRYSELLKGDYLAAYYDESQYEPGGPLYGYDPRKLTRIISVTIDPNNPNLKVIRTDAPIKIESVESPNGGYDYQTMTYPTIDKYVKTYKGIKLTPFVIHQDSIPNGTEERQSTILNVIAKHTNLAKALANKNKISWRYLVDSFGLGLTSNSKQQLADLCGMKMNCLGFLNAPSARQFKNSYNPSFVNDDRTLNTAFLKAGGDERKNPSFLYSFASGNGRSCVAYFFPYVIIDDEGIPKEVPPAAWVATTYMRKFTSTVAGIEPWTICAGITHGRVTDIAGVEMDFTDEDLENLYQMNLNPIVKIANYGYCINSESTAQVFPYSSLSLIHSREVLIELENALYDMLIKYQWRFNTPEIRAEIKYRADKICKDFQDRNAIYNFRNVIDETNNTNYIIDLQMGVLDTYIEIIKGMGIIVNNITILKKGDIESSGFK